MLNRQSLELVIEVDLNWEKCNGWGANISLDLFAAAVASASMFLPPATMFPLRSFAAKFISPREFSTLQDVFSCDAVEPETNLRQFDIKEVQLFRSIKNSQPCWFFLFSHPLRRANVFQNDATSDDEALRERKCLCNTYESPSKMISLHAADSIVGG